MKPLYLASTAMAGSILYLAVKDLTTTKWDNYYSPEKRTLQSYVNPGLFYGLLLGAWKCRLDKAIMNYYRESD